MKRVVDIILNNKRWIIVFIALLLFFSILEDVFEKEIMIIDTFVYEFAVEFLRNDILTIIMKFITSFGNAIPVLLISIIIIANSKDKKVPIWLILNLVFATVLNQILKYIVQRNRPEGYRLIDESGYSFPSGHAMAAFGFYGFIIYLLWHFNLAKSAKIIFSVLLGALIILIGVSRIYLGVHYASDVLAGYMVSLAYLILYITCVKKCLKFGDLNGDS